MPRSVAAAALAFVLSAPALANNPQHPSVVELYQSQGCSNCPPAIANINAFVDRPTYIAALPNA